MTHPVSSVAAYIEDSGTYKTSVEQKNLPARKFSCPSLLHKSRAIRLNDSGFKRHKPMY